MRSLESLIQSLTQVQVIMDEIKTNAEKNQLLGLLKFAKDMLKREQAPPCRSRATLIVPPKFNEEAPANKLSDSVLAQMEDYDFDVHIQNYFRPFGKNE